MSLFGPYSRLQQKEAKSQKAKRERKISLQERQTQQKEETDIQKAIKELRTELKTIKGTDLNFNEAEIVLNFSDLDSIRYMNKKLLSLVIYYMFTLPQREIGGYIFKVDKISAALTKWFPDNRKAESATTLPKAIRKNRLIENAFRYYNELDTYLTRFDSRFIKFLRFLDSVDQEFLTELKRNKPDLYSYLKRADPERLEVGDNELIRNLRKFDDTLLEYLNAFDPNLVDYLKELAPTYFE